MGASGKTPRRRSLRNALLVTTLLCWILPIVVVVVFSGRLLRSNYERAARQELQSQAENALEQTALRFKTAFEASRTVSYDGVVRNAYRLYQQDGDAAALYRTLSEYLTLRFSHDAQTEAVFLSFWEDIGIHAYFTARQNRGGSVINDYRSAVEAPLLEAMRDADTEIRLLEQGGELYLCRNLLDSRFQPYATVVMRCDTPALFGSLDAVRRLGEIAVEIDGRLALLPDGSVAPLAEDSPEPERDAAFSAEEDGHSFVILAKIAKFDLWNELPELRKAVLLAALLVFPMMGVMMLALQRQFSHPVETLLEATGRVQSGERGYVIDETPRNLEFQQLYSHFNSMSTELKNQFERSYREQQALQQAKIKALQSQINPHFLNNTLEIINWEARMAGDERVSAMIEALSTMLDATLDRDGRSVIHLREELKYVDAYLYIICERLGDRLTVEREIDETLLDEALPRLVLQTLVENAVEHDLVPRRGGRLLLRAQRAADGMALEVEHDGVLSQEDLASLERILSAPEDGGTAGGHVGLQNVCKRLHLMYGDGGRLTIEQPRPEVVLARITLPRTAP
ncbi:MAG: HAMP domain-containing protein [Ruminococcaceae bacterium]|nr:HAMP domain-containing protein [Oscillospiraceae bacterium]